MTNPSYWTSSPTILDTNAGTYDLTAVWVTYFVHYFTACAEKLSSQLSLHASDLAFVSRTRPLLCCFNDHLTTWTRGVPPIFRYLGFLASETFGICALIEI